MPALPALLLPLPAPPPGPGCPGVEALDALGRQESCATLVLARAWQEARAAGQRDCLARALEARGLPTGDPFAPAEPPPAPAGDEKLVRDPYHLPYLLESENFALHWGGGLRQEELTVGTEELLEDFEQAWEGEIVELGMPAPSGTDSYKFNIYIGDTGDGAPSSYGAAGYFTLDGEGYPLIVINPDILEWDADYAAATTAHEFFHACQNATGNFQDYWNGSPSAWYVEATAMWVEPEVHPENPYYPVFLFSFAYQPEQALDLFVYPSSGAIEEYHQYGAFIYPRYVSELLADPETIVRSWTEANGRDDPLDVLDELLSAQGGVEANWPDFVARNVRWDYPDGELLRYWVEAYRDYYTPDQHDPTLSYQGSGPSELTDAPLPLPHRRGAHQIELLDPDAGTLHLRFEAVDTEIEGVPVDWKLVLVLDDDPALDYREVEVLDGAASLDLPGAGDHASITLVVSPFTPSWTSDQECRYRYALWVDEQAVEDTAEEDTGSGDTAAPGEPLLGPAPPGCGCGGGAAPGLPALLLGLAGLLRRRATGRSSG